MARPKKTLETILLGRSDTNLGFEDVRSLLHSLGFSERVKGDHHIFYRKGVEEILNLKPKGGKAKAYQVKQLRAVILKYKLKLEV